MIVEVELSPVVASFQLVELAKLVDESGADRLGISDVAMLRDTFLMQALCAQATRSVLIGSLVSNPYVRHPATVAATLATLNEISNGAGVPWHRRWRRSLQPRHRSIPPGAPPRGIPDGGDPLAQRRQAELGRPQLPHHRRTNRWRHRGPVPIVVGTRSRQIAAVAGRTADAVVVGAREMTADALQRYCEWVHEGARAAGRDPADVEIAPRVTLCISPDGEAARRSVALYTAHYLSLGGVEQSGLDPERFRLISRLSAAATGWYFEPDVRYPAELDDLITPDLIQRFAIAGTPQECLEQVRSLAHMGYRSVSMNVAAVRGPGESMYAGLRETVAGLAQIMPDIRRL